jgi:hypothetical protein
VGISYSFVFSIVHSLNNRIISYQYFQNNKLQPLPDWIQVQNNTRFLRITASKLGLGYSQIVVKTISRVDEQDFLY